jgi:hypothetical protein
LKLFQERVFTFCETIASHGFVDSPKHLLILSHYESVTLVNIGLSIESVAAKFAKNRPTVLQELLVPFFVEVFLKEDRAGLSPYEPLLFERRTAEQVDHSEWLELMNRVARQCGVQALNVLPVLMSSGQSLPTDTIYVKEIKQCIPALDDRFREYLYDRYYNETIRLENDFEQFFVKLTISQQYDDLRKRIAYHQAIIQLRFLTQLRQRSIPVDRELFCEELFREEMRVDRLDPQYRALKAYATYFDEALHSFRVVDPRFQEFLLLRQEFVARQQAALERLVEMTLGARFFALTRVFRSLTLLAGKKREWAHGLLCEVLGKVKDGTLFATFLGILHFARARGAELEALSEETVTAVRVLELFFRAIIDNATRFPGDAKRAIRDFT